MSVKLLFRKAPAEVRSLALDEGSRTSAVLGQILLAEMHGVRPRLEMLPVGVAPTESPADAVLVIGDRAIADPPAEFCEAWDLGEQWRRLTGLPFVFAVWAARPGIELAEVEPALGASRDLGCRQIEAIADEQSAAMRLPRPVVLKYLREHLNFYLGAGERHGLDAFFQRAAALSLIPNHVGLAIP